MDNQKELYRLWREYLKRSALYRELCDTMRVKSSPKKFGGILNDVVFPHFGDVFNIDFDRWWKKKQSRGQKPSRIVEDYTDDHYSHVEADAKKSPDTPPYSRVEADLDHLIRQFEKTHEREPSGKELKESFIAYLKSQLPGTRFIKVNLGHEPKDIKDVLVAFLSSDRIQDAIKGMKPDIAFKKMLYEEPTGKPRIDDLQKYLDVYDIWKEKIQNRQPGDPGRWAEIIQHFEPGARVKDADECVSFFKKKHGRKPSPLELQEMIEEEHKQQQHRNRKYQRYLASAKSIISNVERGYFPGKF